MQRDILYRWTPWRFEKETEFDEKTGKTRMTGVRTVFHKSFLRQINKERGERKQEERRGGL